MMLSNVGICGLAVRGLLVLEYANSEAGIGVAGGSAAWDEIPNLTL